PLAVVEVTKNAMSARAKSRAHAPEARVARRIPPSLRAGETE
ncbi:MAG: hypothetical protein QOF95_3367, partial [Pseudonocardiales bacterium]|nr:hypothetical protein [Pseudonocardiales bacterium]